MGEQLSPLSIAAAAMIMQFSLAGIIFIAAIVLRAGDHRLRDSHGLFSMSFGFTLSSIALLLFSDEFSQVWRPAFGAVRFAGIQWATAIFLVLLLDIVWVFLLLRRSGGTQESPFLPILFTVVPLSLFLREPLGHILIYVLLVVGAFTINMSEMRWMPRRVFEYPTIGGGLGPVAFWLVSVAGLVLTTFVGFVTRPQ